MVHKRSVVRTHGCRGCTHSVWVHTGSGGTRGEWWYTWGVMIHAGSGGTGGKWWYTWGVVVHMVCGGTYTWGIVVHRASHRNDTCCRTHIPLPSLLVFTYHSV